MNDTLEMPRDAKPQGERFRVVAFGLDAASLISLRTALPEWDIEAVNGATSASLTQGWNPGAADLLVVQAGVNPAETLGLCRFLVFAGGVSTKSREESPESLEVHHGSRHHQAQRTTAPLVVLMPSEQEEFMRAALKAGADSCLVLPVHAKEIASMLVRAYEDNQAGRHTLNLEKAQTEDRWRDDGGQG